MAACERKVMDRGRTFARSKDQATAEGIPEGGREMSECQIRTTFVRLPDRKRLGLEVQTCDVHSTLPGLDVTSEGLREWRIRTRDCVLRKEAAR